MLFIVIMMPARKLIIKNGNTFYKCSRCKKWKIESEYHKNNASPTKKCASCKNCMKETHKIWIEINGRPKAKPTKKKYYKYDPDRLTYRETHPEQWNEYYNQKTKEYRKDEKFKTKNLFYGWVNRKKLDRPEDCQCCKEPKKLKAYITDGLLSILIKAKTGWQWVVSKENLEKIEWLCSKCVAGKRKIKK